LEKYVGTNNDFLMIKAKSWRFLSARTKLVLSSFIIGAFYSIIARTGRMMKPRIDALRLPLNKTTKGNRINFTPFLEPRDRFPRDESARAVRPDF
jgi:hypothetical protein